MGLEYQRQKSDESRRTCGSACLSMVYQAMGKPVPQEEIWPAIAKENSFGSFASTTHLMVQDAENRAVHAIAFQARHPLHVLRICAGSSFEAILNLRIHKQQPAGHYSVLVGIDDLGVTLHDPLAGPSIRMSHTELLELWQPSLGKSEITGDVLIALAAKKSAGKPCKICGVALKQELQCPSCQKDVSIEPTEVLGCMQNVCLARMWDYICCPHCDRLFDFDGEQTNLPTVRDGLDNHVEKLFSALDKFTGLINGVPNVTNNADIRTQLDFLASTREKVKDAYAQETARRTVILGQLAEAKRMKCEKEQQARERVKEMNKPLPRLDGHELGTSLLKNLGISV